MARTATIRRPETIEHGRPGTIINANVGKCWRKGKRRDQRMPTRDEGYDHSGRQAALSRAFAVDTREQLEESYDDKFTDEGYDPENDPFYEDGLVVNVRDTEPWTRSDRSRPALVKRKFVEATAFIRDPEESRVYFKKKQTANEQGGSTRTRRRIRRLDTTLPPHLQTPECVWHRR